MSRTTIGENAAKSFFDRADCNRLVFGWEQLKIFYVDFFFFWLSFCENSVVIVALCRLVIEEPPAVESIFIYFFGIMHYL